MNDTYAAPSAYRFPLLIKQLFASALVTAPDQEIVSADVRRYGYRTFYDRVGRLAGGLTSLGVARGDTVAVMDWDGHRYLECFFAVPMIGARLHTVNVRLSPEQILYTVNHADDDVILVHPDFMPIVEQIAARFERPIKLILLGDKPAPEDAARGFAADYETLIETSGGGFEFEDFDEQTTATIFYTTGTTGDPKGVYYSHRQLVLHTMGLLAGLGTAAGDSRIHKRDVYMPITPMFHVHAWGFPYAATMLGIKQVYPGRYEPAKLLGLIETEGVTFSHCVPTILHMLLTAPEAENVDLSRWKVIIGGSALPQGLAKAALGRGVNLFSAYGMSETCPFLTVADVDDVPGDCGPEASVPYRVKTGKPTLLVDLRVVDENMNDVPRDGKSTGEVVARTPWLTQGYVKNPAGSEALWQGGYLHTGDVGYIDETGSLNITDRIKDVIKSGGEWLSSLELEDIVSACAGVGEVAAIGVPDPRWGERPMLLVVRAVDAGTEISAETIRDAIRVHTDSGALSKWAIPERIEFVDTLEKTSVGKLDKKAMRSRYACS